LKVTQKKEKEDVQKMVTELFETVTHRRGDCYVSKVEVVAIHGKVALDPIYVLRPFSLCPFFYWRFALEFSVVYVNMESWFEPLLQMITRLKTIFNVSCVVAAFSLWSTLFQSFQIRTIIFILLFSVSFCILFWVSHDLKLGLES